MGSVSTRSILPVLKSISSTTALGGGNITNDGGIPVTARGVCWNTTGTPTLDDSHTSDGTGSDIYTSTLTDLTLDMTYYVRAYATNSLGTSYGNQQTFTQMQPVTDHDGNVYSVVTIGTQIWMGENLKTTTYNDGGIIPYVSDGNAWSTNGSPGYCWYNNDEEGFKDLYGGLYNWYTVNTGKICPAGWHVPNADEFTVLIGYLGGDQVAGGKLKEAGIAHWADPNIGATNTSGFTALPGGGRYNLYSEGGAFSDISLNAYFWSATIGTDANNAISFNLESDLELINKSEYSKGDGGSVRCVMDRK